MNTFLNFIENRKTVILENFNSKKIDKALELIDSVLKKHINGLVPLVGFSKTNQGKDTYYSKQYMVVPKKNSDDSSMFQINFAQNGKTTDAYSIDFFKDTNILWQGKAKSDLTIYMMGSSIVYFLPIIWTVVNQKNYSLSEKEAIKIGRGKYGNANESKYYVGALKYHIYENLSDDIIYDTWKLSISESIFNCSICVINEEDTDVKKFRQKKVDDLRSAYVHKDDSKEGASAWKKAVNDIKDIDNAIRGGANTLGELKLAIKHNVSIVAEIEGIDKETENKFKESTEDPDAVFKKMEKYVKMVIKGINPSVILCGAPGVGKTYNVKKQLKEAGYNEGHNLCTIKGKCTPRVLYMTLMEYKDKGDIVLIDDADGLVGPGAPEDCINILKAGLDSTSDEEGRLINYGVAGKLIDDEGNPVPKKFYYNGGIIVITNYQAGSLDSALRGRSFIQDIHFTTDDVLKRIKSLLPNIDPDHLSAESKLKAFDYLVELSDSDAEMEVSMRTFGICAKIFETAAGDPDFNDDDAKSMIKEQMKLQAQRIRIKRGKY